jgi:uridine monophosphate synthetase
MAVSSAEELAVGLFDRGAIRYATNDSLENVGKPGGYIMLKSGRLSPTYVNLRGLTSLSRKSKLSFPEQIRIRDDVLAAYDELMEKEDVVWDHILGIPDAMTALTGMVGARTEESVLTMRKQEKEHGVSKLIEGDFLTGELVLALDDVITDGASKLETLSKVGKAGLKVSSFLVLVDREEGGRQKMENEDLSITSALGMGGITAILAEQGRISKRQVYRTGKYFHELVDEGIIKSIPGEIEGIT